MDIKEFLLARIAEDEELAQASIEDDCGQDGGFSFEQLTGLGPLPLSPRMGDAAAKLVSRSTPRRWIAECAAKRAIIGPPAEESVTLLRIGNRTIHTITPADQMGRWSHGVGPSPDTLRALASIYSDHADYQQEWAL